MKKLLVHKYEVIYSFYEGGTDFIIVMAENEDQAGRKAIDWLTDNLTTDDWDIEDIVMKY